MSESDDDDNVPLHPTARKPAFTPSKDYLQYLDLGGELAQLGSLKDLIDTDRVIPMIGLTSLPVEFDFINYSCSTMCKILFSGYHSNKRNGNPPRMWSNTSKIGFVPLYDTFRI